MHTAATELRELLTPDQTAERFGTTPGALRADRHRGRGLPYVRIGGRIRYRVADIEAYLAENTVRPGA